MKAISKHRTREHVNSLTVICSLSVDACLLYMKKRTLERVRFSLIIEFFSNLHLHPSVSTQSFANDVSRRLDSSPQKGELETKKIMRA